MVRLRLHPLSLLLFSELALSANTSLPNPIVADPSQQWEGNDGPWSTFALRVGTPTQILRVLISTSGQETWAVLSDGCVDGDISNCATLRGGQYNFNRSSTWVPASSIWKNQGLYMLGNEISMYLGIEGNGLYGFDAVGLSWQGNGPTLNRTIVAGIATKDYFLGQFGISPRSTNFTDTNDNSSALADPQPSYFSQLKSNGFIPSLSYGFTAGSYFRSQTLKNAFGSLVFGGYDSSRFVPNNISFDFAADDGRELVVALQSITKASRGNNSPQPLLNKPILAALDSTQPNLWLPLEACQQFEQAFGLTWNDTTRVYAVNDSLHDTLVVENANITFTLGNTLSGDRSVDIVFPYNAFALTAKWPLQETRYFPLKRADNETQYTLGRVFLQETYLIADYERRNFSIAQCSWNQDSQKIVRINPPGFEGGESSGNSNGLGKGAIGGIVAACIVAVAFIGILVWRKLRQRKSSQGEVGMYETKDIAPGEQDQAEKASWAAEIDATREQINELAGEHTAEAFSRDFVEMDGKQQHLEMDAAPAERASPHSVERFELPGDDLNYPELAAERHQQPMP